ncbi:IQ and ubiquitin-like domain-containing protein isoform X2 [Phyllostomus discolor]|uniref:IQ and ubiquitin-like domain-containing protein isoform X2 n=2 Tax=Phyllostomus discolor TaxID=89673 RepID=A0A7E6CIF9_9CHIR|nr:IQ and ubiquitin-like domain-containing protein isoform X2 [Phyllostomus discolor]
MSKQEEEFDAQDALNAAEESDNAYEAINIPVTSEDLQESEDNELEPEPSGGGRVKEQSDQSSASLPSNDEEQLMEEVMSPEQVSQSLRHYKEPYLTVYDNATQSAKEHSNDYVAFLEKMKAVKETLKTPMIDSSATVKIVLLPVGQEIIISFNIDSTLKYLRDHFSYLLNVPSDVLQLRYAGKILKNNETLLQHGVKTQDIAQVEIFSTLPDVYPVKRINRSDDASQVIIVRVQTGTNRYQQVAVEIVKSDFHKPFLGGFRHKITGIEYHNAGTQTVPKKIPEKHNVFCRDTQTVFQRRKLQQTVNTTSTQMTKIGVYVSNVTDKLVTPGRYFSAAEYHAQRLAAVIVLQTYYRQWHAKNVVKNLRRQKMLRLKWEEQEEQRKIEEKEEWKALDYYRRHNPQTKEDFELLYNALEFWRQEEVARINQSLTGAERKAALCELLEKESQIIASIGRHRYIASKANQEAMIQAFLNKEHECKLTQEILELIDREVDLMMRGVKQENLEGLRKRIATLFFHYIKTPLFNPEISRHLKVPQDPLKFYKKIYYCHSCQLYLPSTEFAISSTSHRINRCRKCISLDNESQQRESFLKYKCLLQRLYSSEAEYEDDSKIAFLMQLQDIQYLIENIWVSQSALSAWNDLNDLVMVRWDKSVEWSPWNCILLTKDEGVAHLKLTSIEEGYRPSFIHKIKHKHFLAKNYFSQIPVLASFLLEDPEVEEIRKKHHPETTVRVIESPKPAP